MGSKNESLLSSWETFVDSMETYLAQEDEFHSFTYLSELRANETISHSGELVCKYPATGIQYKYNIVNQPCVF